MKKLIYRSGAIVATAALVLAGAAAFSAYEAHIVNVTATIENALNVPVEATGMDFGNVFPQESFDQTFNMSLSDAFLAQAGSGANLITNGGFETPSVPTGGYAIYPNASQTGWTVESGAGLEIQNHAAGDPHSGNQLAELDSNNSSAISQTVSTVAGTKYRLSFWYSPRPGRPAGDNTIGAVVKVVSSGATLVNDTIGTNAVGGLTTNWQLFQYDFTASGTGSKVIFSDLGTNDSFGGYLDDVSLVAQTRVNTVSYQIRQKPKCVDTDGTHPQVTENTDGTFVCPGTSTMMPLLCPYLSKHEVNPTSGQPANGINAFHGLPGPWTEATTEATQVTGVLSAPTATSTTWDIDLKTPCFKGQCAQDWDQFVKTASGSSTIDSTLYMADPANEHHEFGCDLWVEVNGITQQ